MAYSASPGSLLPDESRFDLAKRPGSPALGSRLEPLVLGRIVGKPSNGPPVGSFNPTFRLGRYTSKWALGFEVEAQDLKSCEGFPREGSSPSPGTIESKSYESLIFPEKPEIGVL